MSINILFKLKDENGTIIPKNIFWLAFFGVLAVCVLYVVIMFFVPVKAPVNMESRGAFGDMFGAIGALFSGLAFAGLIVTMLQQREDLKNQKDEMTLQREEIELQRKDLEAQTEALRLQKEEIAQTNKELQLQRAEMEAQNKTMMLQRFENTFFSLLETRQKIVNELVFNEDQAFTIRGKDVIIRKYELFRIRIKFKQSQTLEETLIALFEETKDGTLDQYYRFLYRFLQFVDNYDNNILSIEDKYKYLRILQAQFSKAELLMLFYFGLSDYFGFSEHGEGHIKFFIEKYALLKNVRENALIDSNHYNMYNSSAYQFELPQDNALT